MIITKEQKEFIKKMTAGIGVYMETYHLADKIWTNPEGEVEEYIEDSILVGTRFSEDKFRDAVDSMPDEKLRELLYYFDEHDMPMCDVYVESCLCASDSETETKWGEQIMNGELVTFKDFLPPPGIEPGI